MAGSEAVLREHNLVEVPGEVLDRLELPVGSKFEVSELDGLITLRPLARVPHKPQITMAELRTFLDTLPKMTGAEEELYEDRKTW